MAAREYIHLKLNNDVQCLAGHYTLVKEVRLKYLEREVLYVIAQVEVDSSCCGGGRWQYALVYGYILNWHSHANNEGLPVSEVEPITDRTHRENIQKIILETEAVSRIEFR